MKSKMKSGSLKIAIFALSLLLCFALAIGVSSAFYQAKRQASGTVIMDQGIIIDYKGFGQDATATTWGKGVNLLLFETTDAQPGQNIEVKKTGAVSSIKANSDSVDFYARLKLNYEFYNGDTKFTQETLPASFQASDLITTSTSFFGDSWVESSTDGYFYYGSGSTLHKFDQTTDFVSLFADGAKFIIEGEGFEGADNGQGGGFKIDETTSINKIVVTLTLETLQGSADASAEGWTLAPISRIDINEIVNKGTYEITIDDIIPDDDAVRNNEVIFAGDPTQQITITIGSKAFAGCPNLNLSLSDSENIVYQIASDAFANSTGATIMYGLNNVSSSLINPYTSGKEVGIENKWKVSSPNLYLFLPSAIESVSSEYADYQYTDSQGTWYFDLIDENGNRVEPTTTSSLSASTLASTYATSNLTAVIRYVDNNADLTTLTIPSRVGSNAGSEMFDVTSLGRRGTGSVAIISSSIVNVVIPNTITNIGHAAFFNTNLQSVVIPNSVINIGSAAFMYSKLTSITIPDSVTSIGMSAFRTCPLTSITVASGNIKYHSAGNCLIETASKTLIIGCNTSVIPTDGSVTSILDVAFEYCTGLTSITIPDSVTSIGTWAFFGCSSLTSVTIGNSVTSIGNQAFDGCSFTSITIPDSVTSIGSNALGDTLTTVNIGSGVTDVDWLPDSVTNLTISENNENLASDGKAIFTKQEGNVLELSKFRAKTDTNYEIPSKLTLNRVELNVTSIGNGAFSGCSSLTSFTIPDGVTSIGNGAFSGCSSLTSVTIPDSVTSIGESLFSNCTNLTTINIGAGVKEVAWLPDSVTNLTISENNTNLASDGKAIFTKQEGNVLELSKFRAKTDTSYDIPSKLTLNSVELNVTSIGSSAFDSCSSLTSITIPDGVTSIGQYAFSGSGLTSIMIPNSVKTIDIQAFRSCNGLKSVIIPDSVISIGEFAFSYCSKLNSVTIGNGVTNIGSGAFCDCTSLTSIIIPDSVKVIEGGGSWGKSGAFENCTSLQTAVIPEGITSVPTYCFSGCRNLTTVTIPSTVTSIGNSAFENCTKLETVIWNVTYDLNGVNAITTQKVQLTGNTTNGLTISGTLQAAPTDIEDGFTFDGWTDGTTTYPAGSNYTFTMTNRTLKAVWSQYIITFDANGGEGSVERILVEKGSSTTLPAVTGFTKNGFKAIGWSTYKNTTYIQYAGEASYTPTNDVTFYIVWAPKVTISFDLNGGTGTTPETQSGIYGEKITLSRPNIDEREGYRAMGWSTNKETTYVSYNFGSTYTVGYSDVTFYLVWEKGAKVTFDLNGGIGTTPEVMYTFSSKHYITLPTPVVDAREGYKAIGWSTNKDATYDSYYDRFGDNYYAYSDVTLYLVWEEPVKVTFDLNGGTGVDTPETIYIFRNDSHQFTMPTISGVTRDGYIMVEGWSTNIDARTPDYICSFGNTNSTSVDTTFYLVWKPILTIAFDLDGGNGTQPDPIQTSYSSSFNFNTGVNYTKEGFRFGGWSLVNESGNIERTYSVSDITNGNCWFGGTGTQYTFKANWITPQSITFYNDETKSQSFTIEPGYYSLDGIRMPAGEQLSKDDYIIIGWSSSANASWYDSGCQVGNLCTTTATELYAVWKPASSYCKVVLDLSDIDGQENITMLTDSSIRIADYFNPNFDITNAEGKVIAGWSKTQGATEVQYTSYISASDFRGETITLYPVWKEKWNDVAIGSLTASQFAQYQAIWEGKTVDNVDWSALKQLNDNNWHNAYSISVYVNNNLYNDVTYNSNSNKYLASFGYYYQLRNSEYTIKFPNALSANWKLVNYKYQVIQEGTTQIVDGKSQVTINYSYREILDESDNLIFIFILPAPPAEEISTEINMNVMPGNIYDKLAAAGDNYQISESFGGFRYLGILMEVYNADTDQLLYSGTTSYGTQNFATYRLMTGRYKLRVYTTDLVKLGIYSKDDNTEITENITLSDITHGADYSEIIIDYTFVEKAPALTIIFRMNEANTDNKINIRADMSVPKEFVTDYNFFGLMMKDPATMTLEEKNKVGYCFMLMQEYPGYFEGKYKYSVYSQYGKYYESSAMSGRVKPYLVSGNTYTFKFAREIYGVVFCDWNNGANDGYTSVYNEGTKTWDVTITMPEGASEMELIPLFNFDYEANGWPAYDGNVDYTSYCPWH